MNAFRSPAPAGNLFNLGAANAKRNNGLFNAANTAMNQVVNAANTAVNSATNVFSKGPTGTHQILISLVVLIFVLFAVFWKSIRAGFSAAQDAIRQFLGATPEPPSMAPLTPPVTVTPEAPQNDTVHEKNFVEKVLPGRQEVFNISKNTQTQYDAEPLCKALGAELATYEQVKEAQGHGADWCNQGWVKGQMAVYPTQKETWEHIQQGPEDQRNACGRPGVNGGFFDNPELRFGVNCQGAKPSQKDHDATVMTSGEGAPLTPGALEFEKKTAKYRGEANSIGILPFSKQTWTA